jgi:hypothetical protein
MDIASAAGDTWRPCRLLCRQGIRACKAHLDT